MTIPLDAVRAVLWNQLGAAIDTLGNAIAACPSEVWGERLHEREYWYLAFHTIFFLDLYVAGSLEGFAPPPPFGLEELDPAGVLPERVYTARELQGYLDHARARARAAVAGLDGEGAARICTFGWGSVSYLELLLLTARHTQHHAAQLNLLLRQRADVGARWVARARDGN